MAYRCESKGGRLLYYKGQKLLTEVEVQQNKKIQQEAGTCKFVPNDSRKKTPAKKTPAKSKKSQPKKGLYTKAKEKIKAGAKYGKEKLQKGARYVEEKVSPKKYPKGAKKTNQDMMPKPNTRKSPPKQVPVEYHTGKTNQVQRREVALLKSSRKKKGVAKSREKAGFIEQDVKKEIKHTGKTPKIKGEEIDYVPKAKVKSIPKAQQIEKHTGRTNKAPAKPLPPPPTRKSKRKSPLPPPDTLPPPPPPPKSKTKSKKSVPKTAR